MTTVIEEPLLTRLVRAADGEGFEVRGGLRALRHDLVPQREFYALTPTRTPSNVAIRLEVGTGDDPVALAQALKALRPQTRAACTRR